MQSVSFFICRCATFNWRRYSAYTAPPGGVQVVQVLDVLLGHKWKGPILGNVKNQRQKYYKLGIVVDPG